MPDDFDEYQQEASKTAVYPKIFIQNPKTGDLVRADWIYTALGLANEVGELLGKLKKVIRDNCGGFSTSDKVNVLSESGDSLWYLAQNCTELGISLSDVATDNLEKLRSRAERGVLTGSGDQR